MSELTAWLWLANLKGIGPRDTEKLLSHFKSAAALLAASEQELRGLEDVSLTAIRILRNKNVEEACRIEERCWEKNIRILCISDPDYPDLLRQIPTPPLVLYLRGRCSLPDDGLSIGIVGTRRASEYGRETAERLGRELALAGCPVVTGMAEGIDSAAARGALMAHGSVIGVLGCGVDVVYPAWNRKLFEQVAESGVLVSEFPPGFHPTKWSFPKRNRIISGLSQGIAVVQASVKSGSLITAEFAQEQGRDVFVIPGLAGDESFAGSHALIQDGAQLINRTEDILSAYHFSPGRSRTEAKPFGTAEKDRKKPLDINKEAGYSLREQLESLSETELSLVRLLSEGDKSSDLLIRESGLKAGDTLSALMLLQIKGYIREKNGQYHLEVN